ncbi:hypothetical protein [Corynebacterium sp.]|uniref:hypothetical protein n=1 Tax=Corynebacterium sp. TaxID=1720 RepID=UPI002F3E5B4C
MSQAQRRAVERERDEFLGRCRSIVDKDSLLALQDEVVRLGVRELWMESGQRLAVTAERAERRMAEDGIETVDPEVVDDAAKGA